MQNAHFLANKKTTQHENYKFEVSKSNKHNNLGIVLAEVGM